MRTPTSDHVSLPHRLLRLARTQSLGLLALVVALGGTSYAATQLPRNSVTTVQVKDRSLTAVDFRKGQLPRGARGPRGATGAVGPVWGLGLTFGGGDPVAAPDGSTHYYDTSFTLPSAGPTLITLVAKNHRTTCSGGTLGYVGMYVDDVPVPGTAVAVPDGVTPANPVTLAGVVTLSAGAHRVDLRSDCPTGSNAGNSYAENPTITVLRLGSA